MSHSINNNNQVLSKNEECFRFEDYPNFFNAPDAHTGIKMHIINMLGVGELFALSATNRELRALTMKEKGEILNSHSLRMHQNIIALAWHEKFFCVELSYDSLSGYKFIEEIGTKLREGNLLEVAQVVVILDKLLQRNKVIVGNQVITLMENRSIFKDCSLKDFKGINILYKRVEDLWAAINQDGSCIGPNSSIKNQHGQGI